MTQCNGASNNQPNVFAFFEQLSNEYSARDYLMNAKKPTSVISFTAVTIRSIAFTTASFSFTNIRNAPSN